MSRLIMGFGGGRLQCMDRVAQIAPHPIGPHAIDRPPSLRDFASCHQGGGNSGQALASFVHVNAVSFFHSVSISTASFRAVATAALAKPRLAATRAAQLFSVANIFTRGIKVVAASNSRLRVTPSPHFETRPDQSISPD